MNAEGGEGREIHRRICCLAYGEHSRSCLRVLERDSAVDVSVQDDSRPGQTHRVIIPAVIAEIDGLIRGNRQITAEELRRLYRTKT